MHNGLYTIILALFILASCSNKTNNNMVLPNAIEIKVDDQSSLSEIEAIKELVYNNEPIGVKLSSKNDFIEGKTAKGTTLFSKKKFNLFPITTENLENFIGINQLQNKLAEIGLIGLQTAFISLQNSSEQASYFFQENYDKRIIENNRRRDGVIFTVENFNPKIEHAASIDNKDSLKTVLSNLIKTLKENKNEITCYFDINKTAKYINAINKDTSLFNYITCYYLNPVSNKIEPFLMYSTVNKNDKLFEELINNKIIKKGIDFWSKNKNNQANYPIKNEYCNDTDFLEYFDLKGDTLTLKNKSIELTSPLIIPNGYTLKFSPSTKINLTNRSFICSYSPVLFDGTKTDSIYIVSSDKTSQGIHVFNTTNESIINYTVFTHHNNLANNGWTLPSAITFYESPVQINNCRFSNNNCEDGLNIFRTEYALKNSIISNTFSDAFDADFSNGIIDNCQFINSGNDGIDISGSKATIKNCTFYIIADKALSAGENSIMNVDSSSIEKAALAIVSKDLSTLTISNSTINNTDVVYAAFEKKSEFGASKIVSDNNNIDNYKELYLIETNSKLTVDNKEITDYRSDVKDILYGNEYGKKTVK